MASKRRHDEEPSQEEVSALLDSLINRAVAEAKLEGEDQVEDAEISASSKKLIAAPAKKAEVPKLGRARRSKPKAS